MRRRQRREARTERKDSNINPINMKIPQFKSWNDAEVYLEWEMKVKIIFECHNYSEEKKVYSKEKKVKLVAVEFTYYDLVWWDQQLLAKHRNQEPIATWKEMKRIMWKWFVPSYYYYEIYRNLQRLTQDSMSIEDYHKEIEIAMIRTNMEEDREATMGRVFSGLNN